MRLVGLVRPERDDGVKMDIDIDMEIDRVHLHFICTDQTQETATMRVDCHFILQDHSFYEVMLMIIVE